MQQPLSISLADTILARWPDPDSIPYRPWCYVQGYILCGLEKLWQFSGEQRYFDYILRFGEQHVLPDGSIRGFSGESLDDMMAGTVLAALYQHTAQPRYRQAVERIHASFQDYPRNSDGPFGFSEVASQIRILSQHCRKPESGLFLHGWDEARQAPWADPHSGLSPEVWSEGLGWYALILVETLGLLPPGHPERPGLVEILDGLLAGLRRAQDPGSGLWYQVVDMGERPDNWLDTSGSGMFLYTFQRALDLGLARPAETQLIQKGFAALKTKAVQDAQGWVNILDARDGVCVQRSYRDYIDYPIVVNAKEAVGSFLWAAVQIEKSTSGR